MAANDSSTAQWVGPTWVAASAASVTGDASPSGIADLQLALHEKQLTLDDVVHLRLWTGSTASRSDVLLPWLEAFSERISRPTVSILPSDLRSGIELDITAIASRDASRRSIYEPGQADNEWPVAVVCGDLLTIGALGAAVRGEPVSEDPAIQAAAAFERLKGILVEAGARPSSLAHLFVWYRDHEFRQVVNGPFLEMFPTQGDRPSRHSLVRELPPNVALEIEVIGNTSGRRCSYTLSGVWHGGIGGEPNSLPFGTRVGRYLFSAGTYGRDPTTDEIPDDLEGQTAFAIEHSHSLLHAAGMDALSIRHVYVWVRDLDLIGDLEHVLRRDLLKSLDHIPLQLVQSQLPGTNQVQIEFVAVDES
jgi:2-iminobutanoate/2-iminopropanoate deaminase